MARLLRLRAGEETRKGIFEVAFVDGIRVLDGK